MKLAAIAFLALFHLQSPATVAGTWTAEKDGITFARLELRSKGTALIGALSLGEMSVDKGGAVQSVKAAPATMTPLNNISVANGIVSFTWHRDSDEDRFRLRVLPDGGAELTVVLSEDVLEELKEDGIPAPKPIPLRKAR